jgi:arginine-tRNA-protein transferase
MLPAQTTEERLKLYEKYITVRHQASPSAVEEEFLAHCASDNAMLAEYRDAEGRLRALSFLDALPEGLSSVYFAWDPEDRNRSLGSFSIIAEARLAASMRLHWYYLGFWVPGARRMDYKADFPPFELALPDPALPQDRSWQRFQSKIEALESLRRQSLLR